MKPMKTALEKLTGGNVTQGLKTSQTISTEQQAKPAAQLNQETFNRQMHGQPTTPPKDEHEAAVRLNQATANGLMNGTIKPSAPAIKTDEKKDPTPSPKSYAEMFSELNKGMVESPEQQRNREKKERTDAIVRSVGDGLSALARMYFATKGATTAHNPQNDLTASSNKRMEYLRQQRERNKNAWLTGYQRAMALDEEARKNDMTAAEAFRYHKMLQDMKQRNADQGDRRLDQGDERLKQNQQKLDLTRYKYDTDKDYKESVLKIKLQLADGQISRWQAQTAISELTEARKAAKGSGSSSSSRKGSYSGNVEDYITLKQNDPEGMAEAEREARKMGYSPKTASGKAAARIIYKKKHGGGGGKLPNKPSSKPTQKKQTSSKKKSTGVNWK